MIYGRLSDAESYEATHPGFKTAFEFLKRTDLASLPDGRHEIDGDRVFAVIARGPGRGRSGTKLEAHRKYIDIQVTLEGLDEIGWKPTAECEQAEAPFDEARDVVLFQDPSEMWLALPVGSFAVFYPGDGHAPWGGKGVLHKLVVKVRVD